MPVYTWQLQLNHDSYNYRFCRVLFSHEAMKSTHDFTSISNKQENISNAITEFPKD